MKELDQFIQEFRKMEISDLIMEITKFMIWALFILFITWFIRKAINRSVSNSMMRYRAKKVSRIFGYVLIILLAVITFTGKVQYFTVAIGLITAGIAFALQEVILSFAGWITIFSTNSYKPGDRIEINDTKGDVIDIGITKTTLMEIGDWINSDNYNGRIVQVSNASVIRHQVKNYSTDFPFVWDEIILPIRYGSDVELTSEILKSTADDQLAGYSKFARENWNKLVRKYLIEDASVEPTIALKLTDNWIEFNLRYVVDYKKRRITKHNLSLDLLDKIGKTDGKVQLASATFEITQVPEIKIRKEN